MREESICSVLAKLSSGTRDLKDKEAFEDSEIGRNTAADNRLKELPNQRLLAILGLNLKDLQGAAALAAGGTSSTDETGGYELKRIRAASLEARQKDLQEVESSLADNWAYVGQRVVVETFG
ncbi:hypothetical protein AV530_011796 [Patagioenas fasciata monilis]|uniref:Uncharacterized protein n=1 Tax=Patagioenas fasciata monilis TaxID=372326 RepID=A0A1V4KLR8_PATFA|nr:hypothetical protein AV530_011796 [Patagioenas fasciata monilis]